jgi:hypothetical protein
MNTSSVASAAISSFLQQMAQSLESTWQHVMSRALEMIDNG